MTVLSTDSVPLNGAAEKSSLPQLLGELTGQLVNLGRQELALAKVEIKQSARKSAQDSVGVLAGAVILHAGFLVLCAALAVGLAQVMPLWASLLTVGALLIVGGGVTAAIGFKKLQRDAHLQHLPKSLHQNSEFLKEKIA